MGVVLYTESHNRGGGGGEGGTPLNETLSVKQLISANSLSCNTNATKVLDRLDNQITRAVVFHDIKGV